MADKWLDVVIVDYLTPDLAERCRASVAEHIPGATITMVDAHAEGLSYSAAVHRGVSIGTAPFVLALNADTVCVGSQEDIRAIFASDPTIAVVGPRQCTSDGRVTHAGILGENTAPYHRYWLRPLVDVADWCGERILDAFSVSGAVYYCRRDIWQRLGGFMESDFFYEETWLSVLARHHGYRVVYTGQTDWIHEWSSSPVEPAWLVERAAESHAIFRAECDRLGIAHN